MSKLRVREREQTGARRGTTGTCSLSHEWRGSCEVEIFREWRERERDDDRHMTTDDDVWVRDVRARDELIAD